MNEAVALANSLLLSLGWEQAAESSTGQLWRKGAASVSFSHRLKRPGAAWRNFLVGVAQAERSTPQALDALVDGLPTPKLARRTLPHERPSRAELDLHLEPPGPEEHETNAWDYGSFVRTTATAVNELLKNHFGVGRHTRRLQVYAGATAGSVRVRLREPAPPDGGEGALFDAGMESPERTALIILAQLMNTAEEASQHPTDSTLDAQLRVGVAGRQALARWARTAREAQWTITGDLLLPKGDALPVRLTPAGSHRLEWAAREAEDRVVQEVKRGTLDGWLWSEAEMHLLTEVGILRAAVPMALQETVARLNTDPSRLVTATFSVLERRASDSAVVSRSRALVSIEADETLPGA